MVVQPECQGQGIGNRLLQPVIDRASEEGLPCYLITFTERAIRFYQQNGFEIVGSQQLLPNSPPFGDSSDNHQTSKPVVGVIHELPLPQVSYFNPEWSPPIYARSRTMNRHLTNK
jgi:N-acetylglutamate synthase-like GNAT family acetyltransferase